MLKHLQRFIKYIIPFRLKNNINVFNIIKLRYSRAAICLKPIFRSNWQECTKSFSASDYAATVRVSKSKIQSLNSLTLFVSGRSLNFLNFNGIFSLWLCVVFKLYPEKYLTLYKLFNHAKTFLKIKLLQNK